MDHKKTVSTYIEQKVFNYKHGGVQLNFTLRTDIDEELENFSRILRMAQKDVDAIRAEKAQ